LEPSDPPAFPAIRFLPSTHPISLKFATLAATRPAEATLGQRVELLGFVAGILEEEIHREERPRPRGTSARRRFEQLIAQMPDLEIINHTPAELATLCGCSPRHFNRVFRACFGVSVRARQTQLRLLKARQLMAESDRRIMEIAGECGYRNLSLFNLVFKREFGMTPSESRRKAKQK